MRYWGLMISATLLAACGGSEQQGLNHEMAVATGTADRVTVDFDMADAGLRWLALVEAGADDDSLHAAFMQTVAPTAGCQAIIRHWARFRDWDEEIFYGFILEALGRRATQRPLMDENGHPTVLGHARRRWNAALRNPDRYRRNLEALEAADIRDAALARARRYLPPEADVSNRFHVVLFGASNAFSVGDENGFDLLQLDTLADGTIDVEGVTALFAHEMHHSGLSSAMKQHMGPAADDDHLTLPGVLVAEGLATYYLTPPFPKLQEWEGSQDPARRELAADWERHLANMPSLYEQAARDMAIALDGNLSTPELVERWLGGMQGPAYGLGVDMIRTIDAELGTEAAVNLARDPRRLLTTYNEAAARAREGGRAAYPFDPALAERLESFETAG